MFVLTFVPHARAMTVAPTTEMSLTGRRVDMAEMVKLRSRHDDVHEKVTRRSRRAKEKLESRSERLY